MHVHYAVHCDNEDVGHSVADIACIEYVTVKLQLKDIAPVVVSIPCLCSILALCTAGKSNQQKA